MSIDFDSAALQTQHEEEEYDQEDYAREQELQKLLTDLPDDMLDDSRDSSSPELEHSTCSNKNTGSSPPSQWTQQWPVQQRPASHKVYEANFDPHPPDDYAYKDKRPHINGHHFHPESQPVSQAFSQQPQDNCYASYGSIDASMEPNDFSAAEYAVKRYPEGTDNAVMFNGGRHGDNQTYGNHVQDSEDRGLDQYKATYNPHHHDLQPQMFNSRTVHREGHMDPLQREFLDSTQQTADREQLAQLQILHKAQQRQIEDLERKLEDSRRNMRFVEHQFAIVKDEKEGLAVSQKESSRVIEEAKEREAQLQNKLKALEQQVKVLTEREHENIKKQRVAEAAVDSMKQQVVDLCRSDTLSRARQQHDRDLAVMKEQHSAALLTLQQKLDSTAQALDEQVDVDRRLREQVKQLEQRREEEQLERARVVNGLTQRLEESQQQCAKLLESSSVQETTQMQIKLQQAQSAKALCENMNKVLQEDLADLKEQITMYESAVKHGVIGLDLSEEWENQLSDSCVDLGLKKSNRKNGLLHSSALARLSDSKPPKDDALRQLRAEMQRCLGSLKGKRQKISQLQEELQLCQGRVSELQGQLDEAKLSTQVREMSQVKRPDATAESQGDIQRLQEENRVLQEQVEALEKKSKELKQSEDKLRSTNSELCTKMREMIEELDQEKQEASARTERINQQYRDDVVNWLRVELRQEHEEHVAQLTVEHQQQLLQLQTQLAEANDKMLAVQECYISVCKEKDMLEQREQSRGEEEEARIKEIEKNMKEESAAALEKLRADLEAGHQVAVNQLKAAWSRDKEAEIKQRVESQVASEKAAWEEELRQTWELRLEEARKVRRGEMVEAACQGDESMMRRRSSSSRVTISVEELESRLASQKQQLQLEADRLRQKAVVESRKHIQRELHKKHLEDMAKQVEGAVTRAYSRWIEDLTSLPEYQASLRTEREKWEELQEKRTEQRVCEALKEVEEQSSGSRREEELQEEVTDLHTQLEQGRREQAALLKAELAAARAAWNRDKQQELSAVQLRCEQACQGKLQEQSRQLEQALQQAREEAALQRKELLLQAEAKLQQRTEEQRQRLRGELLAELHAALAEVQAHFLAKERADEQGSSGGGGGSSGGAAASEGSVTHIIQTSCRDVISRAVTQAKDEWRKMSEERLGLVLKETQQQQEREIAKMQHSAAQARCRKECGETVGKLQKKNQELQRHLEKACRQLQHSVREHKTAMQLLKEEHESSLEKAKEEQRQRLEGVKRAEASSGSSGHQQSLQQGLEEMKQQYLTTVEKIRGDMLRYLQESRERAAEMIRTEVQRERQDTARKMRRYYLTCLQEMLEDGGKSTGAEKKIMNAASKLAAMAKVLETPVKSKPTKNFSLQNDCSLGRHVGLGSGPAAPAPEDKLSPAPVSSEQKLSATARTNAPTDRDGPAVPTAQPAAAAAASLMHGHTHKPSPPLGGSVTAPPRSATRDLGQQATDERRSSKQNKALLLLLQEAPVRDERQSDWSLTSSDSEPGLRVPRRSWSERRAEPLKQFPRSTGERGDFGGLTPDVSDVTVYKDIAKKTPRGKMSPHRQPTPGSEAGSQLGPPARPLFSELRQRQQDSGFDSPFCQQK